MLINRHMHFLDLLKLINKSNNYVFQEIIRLYHNIHPDAYFRN